MSQSFDGEELHILIQNLTLFQIKMSSQKKNMLLCVSINTFCVMTVRFFIKSSFKHILHRSRLVISAVVLLVEGPASDDCNIVTTGCTL